MNNVLQMTTYGAYSKSQIYTPKDMKELVLYARLRGVKIIPELDAPAHAGLHLLVKLLFHEFN